MSVPTEAGWFWCYTPQHGRRPKEVTLIDGVLCAYVSGRCWCDDGYAPLHQAAYFQWGQPIPWPKDEGVYPYIAPCDLCGYPCCRYEGMHDACAIHVNREYPPLQAYAKCAVEKAEFCFRSGDAEWQRTGRMWQRIAAEFARTPYEDGP